MESYPAGSQDIPASQIYMGKDVRKYGMLKKKSGGLKLFRNKYDLRFIVISKGWVYYYVDKSSLKPQGSFSLKDFSKNVVTAEEEEATMHHVFKLYSKKANERTWYFATKDEAEKHQWMEAFREEIERYNLPSISTINRPSQTWPNKQQTRFPYPDDNDNRSRSVNKAPIMTSPISPHLSYSNTTVDTGFGSSTTSLSPSNPDDTYETLEDGPQPTIPEEPASPTPHLSPHSYSSRPLPPKPNPPSDLPSMPPPEPPRSAKPSHLSPLPNMPPFSPPRKEPWNITTSVASKPRPSPTRNHHFQFEQSEYDNPGPEDDDIYEPTSTNYDEVDPGSFESLPRRSPPLPPTETVRPFVPPTFSPKPGSVEKTHPASSPKSYNFNQPSGPHWKSDSPPPPPFGSRHHDELKAPETFPPQLGPKPGIGKTYPANGPNFNQPVAASCPQWKLNIPPPPPSVRPFELNAPNSPPQLQPEGGIEKTYPACSPSINQPGTASGPHWKEDNSPAEPVRTSPALLPPKLGPKPGSFEKTSPASSPKSFNQSSAANSDLPNNQSSVPHLKQDDPLSQPVRTSGMKAAQGFPSKLGPKPGLAGKTHSPSTSKNFEQSSAGNSKLPNDKDEIPQWKRELMLRNANKHKQTDAPAASVSSVNVDDPGKAKPPWAKRKSSVPDQTETTHRENNPGAESRSTNKTELAKAKAQENNTSPVETDPPWMKEKRIGTKVTGDINKSPFKTPAGGNGLRKHSHSTDNTTDANERTGGNSDSAALTPPWKKEIARRYETKAPTPTTNSEVNSKSLHLQLGATKPMGNEKPPAGNIKRKPDPPGKPAIGNKPKAAPKPPGVPQKPNLGTGNAPSNIATKKPLLPPKTGGAQEKFVDSSHHNANGGSSVAKLMNRFNNR